MGTARWRHVPAAGLDTEVDVSRRPVRVRVDGAAGMPVVLCSPLDAGLDYWDDLVAELSAAAMVIRYDRPVEPGHPLLRDGQDLVALLAALPEQLPVAGPYVLVGASIGAVVARLAALAAPQLVAALVLVDGSNEFFDDHPDIPQVWLDRWGANTIDQDAVELLDRASAFAALSEAGYLAPLRDMPLRVLIAAKKAWGGFGDNRAVIKALDRIWLAGTRLVTCTSLAGVLIAADTDHHIAQEDPRLVAGHIRQVLHREPAADPPVTLEGLKAACYWWADQLLDSDSDASLEPAPLDTDPATRRGWAAAAAADMPRPFDPHAFAETLYQDAVRCYAADIPESLGGLHPALEASAVGVSIGVDYVPDDVLLRAMAQAGLSPLLLPKQHRTAAMPAYTVAYRPGAAPQVLWRHPTHPMPQCPDDAGRQPCGLPLFHPGDHQPDPAAYTAGAENDVPTRQGGS